MKEIRCIAIDDEPLALSVIKQFCERRGGIELTTFSDPRDGMEAIHRLHPDLVFLDIEMDEINGLAIAGEMPDECCFIFTTAYLQYALDGFELDAVDFLHKPFSYERFLKSMDKAGKRIEFHRKQDSSRIITVKQEYNNVSVRISDITHIEAMENYSKIFRLKGDYILTRNSLKMIHDMLPERDFIRVHRSYIVSVGKIESFTRKDIRLVTGLQIPVGRQYSASVFALLCKK